jgi:hypothetical protein
VPHADTYSGSPGDGKPISIIVFDLLMNSTDAKLDGIRVVAGCQVERSPRGVPLNGVLLGLAQWGPLDIIST